MTRLDIERVNALPGNNHCADCQSPNPSWASVNNGIMLCLECAGKHRSFGVDISFVKSLNLDSWSDIESNTLVAYGGNQAVESFLGDQPKEAEFRYFSPKAYLLRIQIKALVAGDEPPKQLTDEQIQQIVVRRQSIQINDKRPPPKWIPDTESKECKICHRKFTITFRRHHCRFCGNLVCQICAPKANTKPIPQLGFHKPVRHCKNCFRSACLHWKE